MAEHLGIFDGVIGCCAEDVHYDTNVSLHALGYTLIELLAVIALLVLAAALSFNFLVRRTDLELLGAVAGQIERFDHSCRGAVVGKGGAIVAAGQHWYLEIDADDPSMNSTTPLDLSAPNAYLIDAGGNRIDRLDLDARGRSVDAIVKMGINGQEWSLAVLGLSGEWSQISDTDKYAVTAR
jgi:prepilin-type N-terminal cleavage/methylation domain-containing protein